LLIVLDTNVLVSGLISPFGAPARVLDQIVLGTIQVAFDDRIMDEYREVLSRPVFGFSSANVSALLNHIVLSGIHVVPEPLTGDEAPDPGDMPFAEVAVDARADCLVTGNLKHFEFLEDRNIPALTPSEFMEGLGRMLDEGGE
jgi:putative PIN family toxin of toxin-antitoxin system